jgi:F-box and WD-40 domain protein CDC4
MAPYTTVGQLSYAPTTQTTVVTTTTTTTTTFPQLVLKPPRHLNELDPKEYPLAAVPTPESLKRFCFDLNGKPTYFREADDADESIREVRVAPEIYIREGKNQRTHVIFRPSSSTLL